MSWNLAVLLTNASNGSPVPGSPLTAAEAPVMGPATPAVITDASGQATLTYNGDLSQYGTLQISALKSAAHSAAVVPLFYTWKMALTLTSGASPVQGVTVYVDRSQEATTDSGGAATVQFKVFASPEQRLQIAATLTGVTVMSWVGGGVVQTELENLIVVGVSSGTSVAQYA